MVELGERQAALNHDFGAKAAAVCDYIFLVGEKQTKPIYDGLIEAGFESSKIQIVQDVKAALRDAGQIKAEGERIVLLENDLPDNY